VKAGTASIDTTGKLREFMANMMLAIRDEQINDTAAARIIKMAGQINESFYSEVKTGKVRIEAGKTMHELGKLPIGEPAAPA